MTWDDVLALGLKLPEAEAGSSYNRPALKVRGKLFSRYLEDGEQITLRATFDERDALVAADPDSFVITEHHRAYEWVVVRLDAVPGPVLEELLIESWRRAAPAKLRRQWDGEHGRGHDRGDDRSFASR
ncbi:MAG: MmcQ/YjbR family DNA-binding protein [Dehalococcoidia bacterium]